MKSTKKNKFRPVQNSPEGQYLSSFPYTEDLKITFIGKLHDDAEHFCFLIVEGLFVVDDEGGLNGGEESDFVESILFIFFLEFL